MSSHHTNMPILRRVAGFCLLTLLVAATGCESEPPATKNLPTPDRSPQAKFDRIVATLHDKLGVDPLAGQSGRFTSPSKAGTGTSVIHYTIDAPEKIEEPAAGKPLMATITITQSTSYSFFPAKGDDEDEAEQGNKQPPTSPLGSTSDELEAMGVEVLDPAMVDSDLAGAFETKLKPLAPTTRTIDNDTKVVYQLIYDRDRWRLAVPPAADSMQATNMALEQALKRQR